MNARFEDLQKNMLAELAATENFGDRYHMAMEYWQILKEIFLSRDKYNEDEEIEFFKNTKPAFTSHIEYYLLLNQSISFLPPELEGVAAYWEAEFDRYHRYCEKHEDFIRYYESYSSEYDSEYFRIVNNHQPLPPQERIYDDEDCRSSHDHIIRGLLAHSMYHDLVCEKLKALMSGKFNERTV